MSDKHDDRTRRQDDLDGAPGEARGEAINLAERFANSTRFSSLFADGMALVEESAGYLDGEGRREAKAMSRATALLYGSESMRLTTRMMQLASWLLLQRAANDGEMTREQIVDEKRKIALDNLPRTTPGTGWEDLPPAFVELVSRSLALQNRILTLDQEIYGRRRAASAGNNPVSQQIDLISTALGASRKG